MNFIQKHKTIFYCIITYLLTGVFFILSSLVNFPLYLLTPITVAVCFVIFVSKENITIFFKRIFLKKFKIGWLFVTIVLSAIITILPVIAYCQINNITITLQQNVVNFGISFIILIIIGCIGEEVGWRGYLLPLLLKKPCSPLKASLLLGVFWGIWHAGDYGEGLGFVFFVLSIVSMSIIMTWLYYKANGNVLIAISFHFFYNIFLNFFGVFPEGTVPTVGYRLFMAVASMIVAIILVCSSPVFKKTNV